MNLQIDLNKLLTHFEGKEVPVDMRAWFALAKEARRLQKDMAHFDEDIRLHEKQVLHAQKGREYTARALMEIVNSMNKVLPQGGEKLWENLS